MVICGAVRSMVKVACAVPTFPAASVAVTMRTYTASSVTAVPATIACPLSVACTLPSGMVDCTVHAGVTEAAVV